MQEKIELLTNSIQQFVSNATPKSEAKDALNAIIQKFGPPLVEALEKVESQIKVKALQEDPNFDEFLDKTSELLEKFNAFLNMHLNITEGLGGEIYSLEQIMHQIKAYGETYVEKEGVAWNRLKVAAVLIAEALTALLVFIVVASVIAMILLPCTIIGCVMEIGPALRKSADLLQIVSEAFNDLVKGRLGFSMEDSLWDLAIHGHTAIPMSGINIAYHANRFFSGIKDQPSPDTTLTDLGLDGKSDITNLVY